MSYNWLYKDKVYSKIMITETKENTKYQAQNFPFQRR